MASFNKVVLIGRLTRDPEKRYTASGLALTQFSIAVDRPFGKDQQTGEKKTDFFRCTAWRQQAEFVAEYIQKGRLVVVDGRIEINESVGQDGTKRFYTDIVCDTVRPLDSQRDQAGPAAASGGYTDRSAQNGGYDDDGYDEPAPARAPQRQERSAPAPQRQTASAAPAPRSAPPQRQAPKPAPASAYPEDDFDDSDPFADE